MKTEGVAHLRDCLGITEEKVVPVTFKKTKKDFVGREEGERRERRAGGGRDRGDGERGERKAGYGRGKRREEGQPNDQVQDNRDEVIEVKYDQE